MDDASSSLDEAVTRIGDRWTMLIVDALMAGPAKFGELSTMVDGIAPNVLTKRIRQLEVNGVVIARRYSDKPVRLMYELTGPGRDLAGALSLLATWGARHASSGDGPHHASCGTPLETRLWCPTCDREVDDLDATDEITL